MSHFNNEVRIWIKGNRELFLNFNRNYYANVGSCDGMKLASLTLLLPVKFYFLRIFIISLSRTSVYIWWRIDTEIMIFFFSY